MGFQSVKSQIVEPHVVYSMIDILPERYIELSCTIIMLLCALKIDCSSVTVYLLLLIILFCIFYWKTPCLIWFHTANFMGTLVVDHVLNCLNILNQCSCTLTIYCMHFMYSLRFPRGEDVQSVKLGFYRSCKIPNVVGAIDGTLIPIMAPRDAEEVYVCRKGYHALNIQAVVDSSLR